MHWRLALVALFLTCSVLGEEATRTQEIEYRGDAFGDVLRVEGDLLIATARVAPFGGQFNVPFPGACCPVLVFRKEGEMWAAEDLLYRPVASNQTFARIDTDGSRIVQGLPQVPQASAAGTGRVFTWIEGTEWTFDEEVLPPRPTTAFGFDVEIDESTLAVLATGDGGSIFIYEIGASIEHRQTIDSPENVLLEIDMDAGVLAATDVLGAAVWIYEKQGSEWQLAETMSPPSGETFGSALTIDGRYLAISGARQDPGKVHMYERGGEGWSFRQTLTAADRSECTYLGSALDLHGSRLLVGAADACVAGRPNAGLARIYERAETGWVLLEEIAGHPPEQNDRYGRGLSLGSGFAFVASGPAIDGVVNVYSLPQPEPLRRRAVRRP